MSILKYQRCLAIKKLSDKERYWFPKWLKGYVQFHKLPADSDFPVSIERVVQYLRSLRDSGVPAWQRLQAARAIQLYADVIQRSEHADLSAIINKLRELSGRDRRAGVENAGGAKLIAGEGNPGKLKQTEPKIVQDMRARLRLMHHPLSTEKAYIGWVLRFIRHVDDERLSRYGESEIAEFLTELAASGNGVGNTQNQALSALLFLYSQVLGRDLAFINSVRAKVSEYRPMVLTKNEISELKDVKTTMIYTHVMNRPGMAVVSPSDRLELV